MSYGRQGYITNRRVLTVIEDVYSLIGQDAFVMISKKLLKFFNGDTSTVVLLQELLNIYKMLSSKLEVDDFGFFRVPQDWLINTLGYSPSKQKTTLKNLEDRGIITSLVRGFPATRHISINFENLMEVLYQKQKEENLVKEHAEDFYIKLNSKLNETSDVFREEVVFDNISNTLKNCIKLVTYRYRKNNKQVSWDSSSVGKLKHYIRNRSLGKPFDYRFLHNVLNIVVQKDIAFSETMKTIENVSRETVELSPLNQILDFKEYLNWVNPSTL